MRISISTDPFNGTIVVVGLSWQEMEELIDGKQLESTFEAQKIFIKVDDQGGRG